jgi:hypothetical protein
MQFEKIADVQAAVNSTTRKNNSYTDSAPKKHLLLWA